MALSSKRLLKLNDALLHRRVEEGRKLLNRAHKDIVGLDPKEPLATAYVLCVAQWIDIGYESSQLLDDLFSRFTKVPGRQIRFLDYIHLKAIEGYLAFTREDLETAIAAFSFLLQIDVEIVGLFLIAQVHFWKGRAHRSQGEYGLALHHILEAKQMASALQAPKFLAAVKIHESWLLFQRGQRRDAFRLLDEAEAELKETGHLLSLGNIESARGRFVRRSGEYTKALAHFERAVEIYSCHLRDHPNLARALVNAAYVKRLIALDLREKSKGARARASDHVRFLEICQEALELLDRAGKIYAVSHHKKGNGTVLVNAAYLYLDCGDIDRAQSQAEDAYSLAEQSHDHILMARTRTLQSIIHNECAEEQIGDPADMAMHANLARVYSEEAVDIAKMTQNKRLLAGAYIARSTAAASDFSQDWDTANQFAALAGELLSREDRDHLSKELQQLKGRVLRATGIHDMLRSWSEGMVNDMTFRQVSEEFAAIVIPKVWMREDQKISRVAAKLSISPNKVRRILQNADLLGRR
jgi:tetratricopeptide (TPR) repeat protein